MQTTLQLPASYHDTDLCHLGVCEQPCVLL